MKIRIQELVESYKEDMLADLKTLIAFQSTADRPEESTASIEFILQRARQFGMRTSMTREKDVGVVEIGSGAEIVGLLVHVDVVDIGDIDKWTHPPFEMVVKDGAIWGRGTEDDKGAAIMSLYTLKAALDLNLALNRRIWLIVGSREETVWTDIDHFRAQYETPTFGFTPDSAFPVYNVENGYIDMLLRFSGDAKDLSALSAGESPNSIPSKATIQPNGGETISYLGKACHSSMPKLGDNAILKMVRSDSDAAQCRFGQFLLRYFAGGNSPEIDGEGHEKPTIVLGIDDGGNEFEGEVTGATSVAPTVLRKADGDVTLNINIRQRYGVTRADIDRVFSRICSEYDATYSFADYLEPIRTSVTMPPIAHMQTVLSRYGIPTGWRVAGGTTYAKALPNFVGWGPTFEGDGDYAHMEDERFPIESFLLGTNIYVSWLADIASGGPLPEA